MSNIKKIKSKIEFKEKLKSPLLLNIVDTINVYEGIDPYPTNLFLVKAVVAPNNSRKLYKYTLSGYDDFEKDFVYLLLWKDGSKHSLNFFMGGLIVLITDAIFCKTNNPKIPSVLYLNEDVTEWEFHNCDNVTDDDYFLAKKQLLDNRY